METKICAKCKQEKPMTTEYFGKYKRNKDGFTWECKVCKAEYDKAYRENNREAIAETKKQCYLKNVKYYLEKKSEYYINNKEILNETNKQYYKDNKSRISELSRQHYQENKVKIKQSQQLWQLDNKDKMKEYRAKYRAKNPEANRQGKQKYKAKIKKLPNTLTVGQWDNIKIHFNNECAYCGMNEKKHNEVWAQQLHQEHFIPLSNNGEYTHNNIIPSCRSCNSSKKNKDFFEWYPTYEHYNRDREKKILDFLGYTTENTQQLALFL